MGKWCWPENNCTMICIPLQSENLMMFAEHAEIACATDPGWADRQSFQRSPRVFSAIFADAEQQRGLCLGGNNGDGFNISNEYISK